MRIVIADDHALFRDALCLYIERSDAAIEIVQADDFHGVTDILSGGNGADLVMLDLHMPGMNGLGGLQKIRSLWPDAKVALMSGLAEKAEVQRALDLGASGYFPKTLPGKRMLQGIQMILQGGTFIPIDYNTDSVMPSYQSDPSRMAETTDQPARQISLTPREGEVMKLLLYGASNKEIAAMLGLQVVTVKLHVRGICRKLGARNRTQAVLLAQQYGVA